MSRTLSSPTAAEVAKVITQPGYLMLLNFAVAGIFRFSSRGDVTWAGFPWINQNLKVGAIQEQANGNTSVSVSIGNADLAFGAVCLGENPQEQAVAIWEFYEGAIATDDPVLRFGGVIDSVDIGGDLVQLVLSANNNNTMVIPRKRITRDSGFNRLMPAGRVIPFNGVNYTLTSGL